MTIYLYVKTHNKTGLKYLGKTSKNDPHKYSGSGKYWLNHLKIYGNDYTTEILKECQNNDEIKKWGMYYSNLWNVVKSDEWANLKEESGDGVSSNAARMENYKRVSLGIHPWLGGDWVRNSNRRRIKEKTHPFLGGEIQRKTNQKRIKEGNHTFLIPGFQSKNNLKRINNGTHNMLEGKLTKKQLQDGTHTSQKRWICEYCGKSGNGSTNYKRWHGYNCSKR